MKKKIIYSCLLSLSVFACSLPNQQIKNDKLNIKSNIKDKKFKTKSQEEINQIIERKKKNKKFKVKSLDPNIGNFTIKSNPETLEAFIGGNKNVTLDGNSPQIYQFTGFPNQRIRITQSETDSQDAYLKLFFVSNGVSTLVAENDDYFGLDSYIEYDIPSNAPIGTYTIQVSTYTDDIQNASSTPIGNYDVSLNIFDRDKERVWINAIFNDLYSRNPTQIESDSIFNQRINNDLSPYYFADLMIHNSDYTEKVVNDTYLLLFNRNADPTGLSVWSNQLNNGMSIQSLYAIFMTGSEYNTIHASNEDFVTSVYVNLLGRQPDGDGYNYFLSLLNAEQPRANVVNPILASDEFSRRQVRLAFQKYLKRNVDGGGENFYTSIVIGGYPLQNLHRDLVSSVEYRFYTPR